MEDDVAGAGRRFQREAMLISTSRLASLLDDADCVLFDCRHDLADTGKGARLYADGHIPGAFFAPVDTALSGPKNGRNGRHPLPAPDAFAAFLENHGVTSSTQIVAYDDAGGMYAARLWWLARWIGLTNVALLDGGLPKWVQEGRPLSTEPPPSRPRSVVTPKPQAARLVAVDEVQASLSARSLLVVDARAAERYRGDIEPIDPVAGHIPGAVNRFYKANLNPDGTLKGKDELRRDFETLLAGRGPSGVAHQCGSGITACANLFAMDYAGLEGSRLYAGSWSEWVADPGRPVERG